MTRPRRRRAWRPLVTAAVAAAILTTTLYGVQATVAEEGSQQAVVGTEGDASSGTLALVVTDRGAGLSSPVGELAPGDVVHRYVDLASTGSLAAQDLRLQVAADDSPLLPVLRAEVAACATPWQDGSCSEQRPLLPPTSLSALGDAQPLAGAGLPAGAVLHLRVTLALPESADERTAGRATALTWTFSGRQDS